MPRLAPCGFDGAGFVDARLVAVELRLTNVGEHVYQDNVFPGARLIVDDRSVSQAMDHPAATECDVLGDVTLAAGETTTGCFVFEVPGEAAPDYLQLRLGRAGDLHSKVWELGT